MQSQEIGLKSEKFAFSSHRYIKGLTKENQSDARQTLFAFKPPLLRNLYFMAIELNPFWSLSYSLVEVPSFISAESLPFGSNRVLIEAYENKVPAPV